MLLEIGCRRGDLVGILIPKSIPAIVAILGCLKADCVYVPLDLGCPPARLRCIMESCQFRCILASGPAQPILNVLLCGTAADSVCLGWLSDSVPPDLNLRFSQKHLISMPTGPVDSCNRHDAVAHILFTSGSTGTPKGVMITHASVLAFVDWGIGYFGYRPSDRMSGHPPLHFDLSTFDIFGTLAAGGSLHLITPEMSLLPHKLAESIRTLELTQWFSVPSLLNYMAKFDAVRYNDFPALRRVLWCGEVFPTPALIYWMRRLPHVTFTNLYGPTETTIASGFYRVPQCPADEHSRIPIGMPCPGEEFLVLDEELHHVATGQIGELYIGGVGLSPGYWRDPEKTGHVFIRNPYSSHLDSRIYRTGDLASIGADGFVYLHGRTDSQIKSRGYRIELGEVETAVHATGAVRECAVAAVQADGFEGTTIWCAYVPAAGRNVSPQALRAQVAKTLPSYMIPNRWMNMSELPLNANGKIDRPAIKRCFETAATTGVAAGAAS
jgi:amino acid adenylation domain-containing protein